MIFNQNAIRLEENFSFKLNDSVLQKLEDGYRRREKLLVTIDASHYSMINGNDVLYRHDTVRHNINSFLYPECKPLITNHRPKDSQRFGSVIAVDYKETPYYNKIAALTDVEGLSTHEYISMCKDTIIPYQKQDSKYNGLGYCEVVGKIEDQDAIKKVLSQEFLNVSIGANPIKLFCSHCLQDQVVSLCDHFSEKGNGVWFLSEELAYEELSFLVGKKPADPFGRVTRIHDGKMSTETMFLERPSFDLNIDIISAEEFFNIKLADSTKTIVCVDNICKVINQEDTMAKKAEQKPVFNISFSDEFKEDSIKELSLTDSEDTDIVEALKLTDEVVGTLKNADFAIIQKTDEGTKRRFPLHDELNVKAAIGLFGKAEDLTPSEVIKAKKAIEKAAGKLGIECKLEDAKVEDAKVEDEEVTETDKTETATELTDAEENKDAKGRSVEEVISELKVMIEQIEETKLQDADATAEAKPSPVTMVFSMLSSLATSLKWAGEDLKSFMDNYLKELGKEAIDKGVHDSMKDELTTAKAELEDALQEVESLEEDNRDLNLQVRKSLVDELLDSKQVLGLITDSIEVEKTKLSSYPYNVLVDQVGEFRQLKEKQKSMLLNNTHKEEISTVTDPTLTDSVDVELTDSVTDDVVTKKTISITELEDFIHGLMRS